jgi:hypothetical protein
MENRFQIFDFRFWILDFRNERVDAGTREIEKAFGANSVAGVRGDRSATLPTGNRCIHNQEGCTDTNHQWTRAPIPNALTEITRNRGIISMPAHYCSRAR